MSTPASTSTSTSAPASAVPPAPELPSSRQLIVALGLIAMISGLLVAVAYQVTLPIITRNRQEALKEAIFTVLPAATSYRNYRLAEGELSALPQEAFAQANVFAGFDDRGALVGFAMEASARGYQDVVTLLYAYAPEREAIVGMTVLASAETPGIGDKVSTDPAFRANFEQLDARLNADGTALAHAIVTVKNGRKTEPWQIDGISGATITSTAIGTALNRGAAEMLPDLVRQLDRVTAAPPATPAGGSSP